MSSHVTDSELRDGIDKVRQAPTDNGVVNMIVVRPKKDYRNTPKTCELSAALGMHGDCWASGEGCSKLLPNGKPHPDIQVSIMNSRSIHLLTRSRRNLWCLAGNNLYINLDLSEDNMKCGQRLSIGSAELEITSSPLNAGGKFAHRFGDVAKKFVNSAGGKKLHLRGVYAKIIKDGTIKVGDIAKKIGSVGAGGTKMSRTARDLNKIYKR